MKLVTLRLSGREEVAPVYGLTIWNELVCRILAVTGRIYRRPTMKCCTYVCGGKCGGGAGVYRWK